MAEHAARRVGGGAARSRSITTLAITTGALLAANLVTLTVHDSSDEQRQATPAANHPTSRRIPVAAAAPELATAEPDLFDLGGPILSSGPVGTAALAPPPVISFDLGIPAVAATATPVSSTTIRLSAAPSAAQSPAAPAEAPRAEGTPEAPTPPSRSTPPILSALPTELAVPNLPEVLIQPLSAVSDLVGVDLSVPSVSGSDAIPLIVQPAATSAAAILPGSSLGL